MNDRLRYYIEDLYLDNIKNDCGLPFRIDITIYPPDDSNPQENINLRVFNAYGVLKYREYGTKQCKFQRYYDDEDLF